MAIVVGPVVCAVKVIFVRLGGGMVFKCVRCCRVFERLVGVPFWVLLEGTSWLFASVGLSGVGCTIGALRSVICRVGGESESTSEWSCADSGDGRACR